MHLTNVADTFLSIFFFGNGMQAFFPVFWRHNGDEQQAGGTCSYGHSGTYARVESCRLVREVGRGKRGLIFWARECPWMATTKITEMFTPCFPQF